MDKVSSRHVSWIDLEKPTEDDITSLTKKHNIHPLVAQELLVATYRPKVENYDDHLYLVLHFPIFDEKKHATLTREIDFIIFPYSIVTVHYGDVDQLDDFQQFLAGHEAIRERSFGFSSGHLLYSIISRLFAVSLKELDVLESKIKETEAKVFGAKADQKVLRDIALMKRDILSYRKALKPQEVVLESLSVHGTKFFGAEVEPYFNDIKGEYIQLRNSVEDFQEILDVLYDTNASLLDASSNNVMKILTVMTSLLLPATLVGTIYGMNFGAIPFTNTENGFWVVMGLMVFMILGTYWIFKTRKWL
ncbi:MAG: magnesium transporter CorA family protein [bacterium]|nr:magnesium transporter CorA family protein [bacterium]